jgi:hypothetical protein
MSIIQEKRRALTVVDAANAQKLIFSIGRENLSDAELDTAAKTAMDILHRETYYENLGESIMVEKKRDCNIYLEYVTKKRSDFVIRPIESH